MKTLILIALTCISMTMTAQPLSGTWILCNMQGDSINDPYYSQGTTIKWDGPCQNGKANGFGTAIKHENGTYHSTYEGFYKEGIREGMGKFSHKDGSVKEGTFINGQLIGLGKFSDLAGNSYNGEFINYRMHGKGTFMYANGAKIDGFFVSDQLYTGTLTDHAGNITYGQALRAVSSINETTSNYNPPIGVLVTEYFNSVWKRCNAKDALYYRRITYKAPNQPIGCVQDYYLSGELQSEFYPIYLDYDEEGKNFLEGSAIWYYKSGKVQEKRFYSNGKIDGKNTSYYENGQLAQELVYAYGILNGELRYWYPNGKLKIRAKYENGQLVGNKYAEFDENGMCTWVFDEIFSDSKTTWESKETDSQWIVTDKNQLQITNTKNNASARFNYIPLALETDFSIELVLQKKTGKGEEGYGLIFGLKDWDDYFNFVISDAGAFYIAGSVEGTAVTLAAWQKTDAIELGHKQNVLKVMKVDSEFLYMINGVIVYKTEQQALRGNNYGVITAGTGVFNVEKLLLKQFYISENIEPNGTENGTNDWAGNGSGFFINEKGYIATNYHVIENATDIQIEFYRNGSKQVHRAIVVVSDKQNDLAILKIDDADFVQLPQIPYVFSTGIKEVGTSVFALGFPMANVMGEEIKFTDGRISSKTGIQGDVSVYQISTPIQQGNSGGPLFDEKGNLVGITSSGLNREQFNSENVNYAIKTSYLKSLIDVLPESIVLPNNISIYGKPLTVKIKLLSDYVPLIKIR